MHMQLFVASNLLWHNHIKYSPPTRFSDAQACGLRQAAGGGGNILEACSSFCLAVPGIAARLDPTTYTPYVCPPRCAIYIILKTGRVLNDPRGMRGRKAS